MKRESDEAVAEIMAILEEKGLKFSSDDRSKVDWIRLTRIAPDDSADCVPWLEEAIHNVISDPFYEGDIAID